MTRSLDAAMLLDIAARSAEKTELVELHFELGVTRLTTAGQDLLWDGFTWEAVGGHFAAEGFGESVNFDAGGCQIQLSGVSQEIVALALGGGYRGRVAKCWHAHFNRETGAVLVPVLMFDGYMNSDFVIEEDRGEYGDGEVLISTRLTDAVAEISRLRGIRTNTHSHRMAVPAALAVTDGFFKHVPSLTGKKIYWGVRHPATISPATPGRTPYGDPRGHTGGRGGQSPWPGVGGGSTSGGGGGGGGHSPWPGVGPQAQPGAPNMDPGRTG